MSELEAFTAGYLECLLWQGLDWSDMDESDNPTPLDENHGIDDIALEALAAIGAECAEFVEANRADLESAAEQRPGWDWLGHDFCLTRNGHGAGFWDRGLGELGQRLTEASHPYGESGEYVADDGLIYV